MSDFRRVQANAEDPFTVWHRVRQRLHRCIRTQMAKKAHDQPAADVEPITPDVERPVDAGDDRLECDSAIRMSLRIEEDLGVTHALGGGTGQVSPGEVVEVLFPEQYATARVIDVEEGLQVAENVGAADVLDRGIWQGNGVPVRQLEHQLRLECALNVQMKLGLW